MNQDYMRRSLNNNRTYIPSAYIPRQRSNSLTKSIQTLPPPLSYSINHNQFMRQGYPYPPQQTIYSSVQPNLRYSQIPILSPRQSYSTIRRDNLTNDINFNSQLRNSTNGNYKYSDWEIINQPHSQGDIQSPNILIQDEDKLLRTQPPLFDNEKRNDRANQISVPYSVNPTNKTQKQRNIQHDDNFKKFVTYDTQQILQKWNGPNQFGVNPSQNKQFYSQIRKSKEQILQSSPLNIQEPFETISSFDASQQLNQAQLYNQNDRIVNDKETINSNGHNIYNQDINAKQYSNQNQFQNNQNEIQTNFASTQGEQNQQIMRQQTELRVGIGYDVHQLVKNKKRSLILGGVKIEHNKVLDGHSDADALIHSIIDALLGACNYKDIGQQFPNSPEYKDISSIVLLKRVREMMDKDNIKIVNVDSIIIAQKPKISDHKEKMQMNISEALKINPERVSIKATTEDKLGFTGSEQGIACKAICMIEKPIEVSNLQNIQIIQKQRIQRQDSSKRATDKQQVNNNTQQKTKELPTKENQKVAKPAQQDLIKDKKTPQQQITPHIGIQNKPKQAIIIYSSVAILLLSILFYLLLIK